MLCGTAEKNGRTSYKGRERGERVCVLCLGDRVTEEGEEVLKNEEGPSGLTSFTEGVELEGGGDSEHKTHENERVLCSGTRIRGERACAPCTSLWRKE